MRYRCKFGVDPSFFRHERRKTPNDSLLCFAAQSSDHLLARRIGDAGEPPSKEAHKEPASVETSSDSSVHAELGKSWLASMRARVTRAGYRCGRLSRSHGSLGPFEASIFQRVAKRVSGVWRVWKRANENGITPGPEARIWFQKTGTLGKSWKYGG